MLKKASVNIFSTCQVARYTGLTIRQLDYWAQKEIFVPSLQQADGPGTRKLYSFEDIIQLRCLAALKCNRSSTQKIRAALNLVREVFNDPDPLKRCILAADHGTILAVSRTKEGERLLMDALTGQQVLTIVLETLTSETRQMVFCFLDDDQDRQHEDSK